MANTAAYLRNFIPLERLNGKTPYEIWFGHKPDVSHLRVIGSRAFAHVPNGRKLDNRAKELILVGYEPKSHSYRLWKRSTNGIKITPSVKIIESLGDNQTRPTVATNAKDQQSTDVNLQDAIESIASRTRSKATIESDDVLPHKVTLCVALSNGEIVTPQSFEEAINSPQSEHWIEAMQEEMNSLHNNDTYVLVDWSKCSKKPLKSKWVYKTKMDQNGNIDRFKARLCVKGCSQKFGIDYNETFSPVARYETIRTLLAIAAHRNLQLCQFDIGTAFLNGELEEVIYMDQPDGFEDGTSRICKLVKSLYGLKQAPRAWNSTFDRFLQSFGLKQSSNDPCLYVSQTLFLVLYVDDGLIAAQSGEEADRLIQAMQQHFDVKTSEAQFYLGLQIERNHEQCAIKIHQQTYIWAILEKFQMIDCNPVYTPAEAGKVLSKNSDVKANVPYRQIIGSLMYLTVSTRPDIAFIVGKLCQHLDNPSFDHWYAAKRVLAYLKATSDHGIVYYGASDPILRVFTDADYAMCVDTRKSTSGVVITFLESPIAWISHKQGVVADSTTYAEYIAAHDGAREVVWIRRLLSDFWCKQTGPTDLFCDNEAAIKLITNPQFHQRTKHIDTQFHYVRDVYGNNQINIVPISTKGQLADLFTKPLPQPTFHHLKELLNIY